MGQIVLDRVTKAYPGDVRGIDELSLEVADGEFMVLVGPSGCGKSTALRSIAGLEEITSGTIAIGSRVVRGRIDAVFAEPDGGTTVVDWKTGERPRGAEAARQAAIQLGVYRLAWAALSGGIDDCAAPDAPSAVRPSDRRMMTPGRGMPSPWKT